MAFDIATTSIATGTLMTALRLFEAIFRRRAGGSVRDRGMDQRIQRLEERFEGMIERAAKLDLARRVRLLEVSARRHNWDLEEVE